MPLTATKAGPADLNVHWELPVTTDRAWEALTMPALLDQWLGTVIEGEVTPGADFTVAHGEGYNCISRVSAFKPNAVLRYSWLFPDEPASEVSWALSPAADSTNLRLVHRGLAELVPSYRDGWITHLTYLEAAAVGTPLSKEFFWNLHATVKSLGRQGGPAEGLSFLNPVSL